MTQLLLRREYTQHELDAFQRFEHEARHDCRQIAKVLVLQNPVGNLNAEMRREIDSASALMSITHVGKSAVHTRTASMSSEPMESSRDRSSTCDSTTADPDGDLLGDIDIFGFNNNDSPRLTSHDDDVNFC